MPALLKWGLVLIVPDAILDVYLTINLVVFLSSILDSFFWPRWRDDLPVYRCFLCLGQRLGPVFGPLLDRTLDRVSGTWKSNYAPCRIKIPWTCVCPSRTRVSIR
jgi:hypothetical protein